MTKFRNFKDVFIIPWYPGCISSNQRFLYDFAKKKINLKFYLKMKKMLVDNKIGTILWSWINEFDVRSNEVVLVFENLRLTVSNKRRTWPLETLPLHKYTIGLSIELDHEKRETSFSPPSHEVVVTGKPRYLLKGFWLLNFHKKIKKNHFDTKTWIFNQQFKF